VTDVGPGDQEPAGDQEPLEAGDFASWLGEIGQAIRGRGGSEVPCDGCTACCRSRQFVPVGPDEPEAIAHIPPELLFPAPGMPEGSRVLGYDEQGHCPMLVDDRCSIYEHRPRACRTYDCRVFAATGVGTGSGREPVAKRVARWHFSFDSDTAVARAEACRSAAAFLDDHADLWPDRVATPPRLATSAVAIHDLFAPQDGGSGTLRPVTPDPAHVASELDRRTAPAARSGLWRLPVRRRLHVGLGHGQVGDHGHDERTEHQ
jgi:Fe-S-cluster containining protein